MKTILSISIALLISLTSFSQDKKTYGGIKVGTTLPGTIHVGALLEHNFNKNIAFEGEVLYNQKNLSLTGSTDQFENKNGTILDNTNLKYTMHYIQVPLNFKVSVGNKIRPYVMAGLAASFLIASSNNFPGKPVEQFYTRNVEFSYLGSVGVDYKPLFIEVRYNAGINSAVYNQPGYVSGKSNFYNRNLMISIGVKF